MCEFWCRPSNTCRLCTDVFPVLIDGFNDPTGYSLQMVDTMLHGLFLTLSPTLPTNWFQFNSEGETPNSELSLFKDCCLHFKRDSHNVAFLVLCCGIQYLTYSVNFIDCKPITA